MRLILSKQPLKRLLPWIQRFLVVAGVGMLSYCAILLAGAWSFQHDQLQQFRAVLAAPQGIRPPAVPGGLIGNMEISRLGVSVIVVEGVSGRTLRRAAGHIPGTALPGQPGNVGISAHRDTYFRPLRNIRRDDMVTVTTLDGEYHYRVVSTQVVGPHDVGVLDASRGETLTLVTCYPFYFVGPAPERFIVRAERVTDYL